MLLLVLQIVKGESGQPVGVEVTIACFAAKCTYVLPAGENAVSQDSSTTNPSHAYVLPAGENIVSQDSSTTNSSHAGNQKHELCDV
jgi:hypothetical protein